MQNHPKDMPYDRLLQAVKEAWDKVSQFGFKSRVMCLIYMLLS